MAESIQNKHMEHLEDRIIDAGSKGAAEAIFFIKALIQTFGGTSTSGVNITTKFDGAPAVVTGRDPETGWFFVATKHAAFAKNMRLAYSEAECDIIYEGKGGLKDTMKSVFRALEPLKIKDVFQGDVMFTETTKKTRVMADGIEYVTFKPNTIMYAVPVTDVMGQQMLTAEIGIVFHTKYSGSGPVNTMSAAFNVDVSKLKVSKKAWIEDASYKNLAGTVTLTTQETAMVQRRLTSAKSLVTRTKKFIDAVASENNALGVGYLFKLYINKLVRENALTRAAITRGLKGFILERIKEKIDSVSTVAAKGRWQVVSDQMEDYLRKNDTHIRNMIQLYDDLLAIKNLFVKKLAKVKEFSTFLETPAGFEVTGPEGFVAVNKIGGNAVKLVNRLEFSQANFNAVKDWKVIVSEKDEEIVIPPPKIMTFTFGRFNPPTIGHEKLINKIKEIASANHSDHLIILSHSQDKKKNPLSGEQKLEFCRKLFPNTNFDLATPAKPSYFKFLEDFANKSGYTDAIMIVGSDRVAKVEEFIHKYNTKDYTFKSIQVLSAGERDPDEEGASGMSASKMRGFVEDGDFDSFRAGLPERASLRLAKDLYLAVKRGMEIGK